MKSALITGANRSIGFESTRQMLKEGYYVYLGSRNVANGQDIAHSCHLCQSAGIGGSRTRRPSAPRTGRELPIILLSHGHENSNHFSSLNGYAPIANYYTANGFIVIQPTHLDSKTLTLDPNGPEGPLFLRSLVEDMKRIIDQLDTIENAVPEINPNYSQHWNKLHVKHIILLLLRKIGNPPNLGDG